MPVVKLSAVEKLYIIDTALCNWLEIHKIKYNCDRKILVSGSLDNTIKI
ncbi:MAG: hypothetical protein V7K98_22505 [Nostoc sp.]